MQSGTTSWGIKRHVMAGAVAMAATLFGTAAAITAPLDAMPHAAPLPASTAAAASSAEIEQRWQASFDAFAAADRARLPAAGGVLFVGSSSIRLWDGLETQFSALPVVVKRGFGGSLMSDCTAELQRLVVPYRPRLVIVYAGDNDLAEGRSPDHVLASFKAFVQGVRSKLPQTRIAYLSIKPSPLRAALLPAIRQTNALIAHYIGNGSNLDYIDVYTPMLGADGKPRAELFRADALHLNDAGYALWRRIVALHVR